MKSEAEIRAEIARRRGNADKARGVLENACECEAALALEWVLSDAAPIHTDPPTTRECGYCAGTGKTKTGEPCGGCDGTGVPAVFRRAREVLP